jgi:HAD superfamily hydrolase (TIGR01509 family)
MTPIDAIVFDVGRVLVHLDFQDLAPFLARHGVDASSINRLAERIGLAAHERGEFGGEAVLDRFIALADRPMDREELRRHWLDIFEPAEEMMDLARRLASTRRVFLLSNAGDLHWEQLNRQFGIESLALDALPSFRARVAKPDAEIYRQAEERFGLEPRATVFIDDLAVNVDAARQRGWRGIHHLDHRATIEDLRTMGVPV